MSEPIQYVGGQPEGERRRPSWPILAAGVGLIGLLLLPILLWTQIRTWGRAVGDATLPYSVNVKGAWSSGDKVAGGPVTMTLQVDSSDPRAIQGMTLRLKGLSPSWSILSATPDATVGSDSIYFRDPLRSGGSETLEIRLMPLLTGDSSIQLTMSPGQGAALIRMRTGTTTMGTVLNATASVRAATPSDVSAQPHLYFTSDIPVGNPTTWQLRIDNSGAVRITSLTVEFAVLPDSFEITSSDPHGTVAADGRSVRFPTQLDPGDGITVTVGLVPHAAGKFHIVARLYLSDAADPITLPDGSQAVDFDVTVN